MANEATNQSKNLSTGVVVLLIISVAVICYIAFYIFMKIRSTTLKNKVLLTTPIQPSKSNINVIAHDSDLPTLTNGREYAYSFWMYIDDLDNGNVDNLVFLRSPSLSDTDFNIKDSNVVAFIAKGTNQLVVKLKTQFAVSKNATIDATKGLSGNILINGADSGILFATDECYFSNFIIEYVPLQRWVNVVINVDNDLVSLFMDGNLLSTKNIDSLSKCNDPLTNIITGTMGTLFTGSSISSNLKCFDGYLSRMQFFNYSITLDHAKAIYKLGPVKKSWLGKLGIDLYALRSPIVRIDSVSVPVSS